jgi:DNA replication protein DnaC
MLKADIEKFKKKAALRDRYSRQLARLRSQRIQIDCIESAVKNAVANLAKTKTSSLVIYGEPQSGKTEMMICLTAKLLDEGHSDNRSFGLHPVWLTPA